MADKTLLSVVILTKNEAARLVECIRSVAWADEILVVDDESTDETVSLAESLGAKVLRRKMDIEGRHRNWAYARTRHEWVLSLDADERVTPELAEEIQQLLRGAPPGVDAGAPPGVDAGAPPYDTYAIPRRNYIGAQWIRHGGWYPSAQLKMFKKSLFRWEEASVHPRAISDRPCGTLQHDLIHLSYQSVEDFARKQDRYTTLEAEKWVASGRRVTVGKALWRTIDRFFRTYVLKQGFREGILGWSIAWMAGSYQWDSYCKYRAATRR